MKTHYLDGCPWANGEIQQADTDQTTDWRRVTCGHCLKKKPRAARRVDATIQPSPRSRGQAEREQLGFEDRRI